MLVEMDSNTEIIYMPLLNEGIPVWKPVEAFKLDENIFIVLDNNHDPSIETWQFPPPSKVFCTQQELSGEYVNVASKLA